MSVQLRSNLQRLLLALFLGVLGYFGARTSPAQQAEWATEDQRIRSGILAPDPNIVIIKITDQTRSVWTEPTAFWGPRMARVLQRLSDAHVKWIGLDWLNKEAIDELLQKRIPNAPSYQKDFERELGKVRDKLTMAQYLVPDTNLVETSIPAYQEDSEILGNVGSANLDTEGFDGDGIKRRASFAFRQGDQAIPTFAAAMAAGLRGIDPRDDNMRKDLASLSQLSDPDAAFFIRYSDRPFQSIDIVDLDKPALDANLAKKLDHAIVLIGADLLDDNDHWRTPVGPARITGVEVHANILATLLNGAAIDSWKPAVRPWLAGILSAATALAATFCTPLWSGILTLGLLGGWTGFAAFEFGARHTMIPLGSPLACATLGFGAALAIRSGYEAADRRRIEGVFGKHVSKEVQAYLLSRPENLALGGREVEGSVLFVDIWDSVGRGATRSAEALMSELNEVFQAITPAITENNGLINRFTGDGFIAIFGVPLPTEAHADSAVRASIAIQTAIERLNAQRSIEPFTVSCGIHSGRFVCGNIGSDSRAEFAVIGDVVNTAARIESANRNLQSRILVSTETYALLHDRYPAECHCVPLKGKGLADVYALCLQPQIVATNFEDLHTEVGREP